MELSQFRNGLRSENFNQSIKAISTALNEYYKGLDIQDLEEEFERALIFNPKLEWLVDNYGNPFKDGISDFYESKESMIEYFEQTNNLELSEQQEIFIEMLKKEEVFDIVAANSVVCVKPFIDSLSADVYKDLSTDDLKVILSVLDNKNQYLVNPDNLDYAVKGMLKTAEHNGFDQISCIQSFEAASLFLKFNPYGIDFDQKYNAIKELESENNKINRSIAEKIYEKVVAPQDKPKFSLLDLERAKAKLNDRDFDDDDFEEKPAKRMKLKM